MIANSGSSSLFGPGNLMADLSAVVTGASSGIGKAIALLLAQSCRYVHVISRDAGKLRDLTSSRSHGSTIVAHELDLSVDGEIAAFAARINNNSNGVDVLVHSAGVISLNAMSDARISDFDTQFTVNVRAAYLLTQLLLPAIKACRGQVVFINSRAGVSAGAMSGQYSACKHALKAVADSLRQEVNPHGVRVLSVYPGRTATPMQQYVHSFEAKQYRPDSLLQAEDVAAMVKQSLLMPRTAEVTDIYLRSMSKP